MDDERETQAEDDRLLDIDALLRAAGVQAPAGQLRGLADDYEQIRGMAVLLRSAEAARSWPQKREA